jgi:hypothetical protein
MVGLAVMSRCGSVTGAYAVRGPWPMSYHIDIFTFDTSEGVATLVARLSLGAPASVLVESIGDAEWSKDLMKPVPDGLGGMVAPEEDPRLFLNRFVEGNTELVYDGSHGVMAYGPHDGDGCLFTEIGVAVPAAPTPVD